MIEIDDNHRGSVSLSGQTLPESDGVSCGRPPSSPRNSIVGPLSPSERQLNDFATG